jgi:hypothetical protein
LPQPTKRSAVAAIKIIFIVIPLIARSAGSKTRAHCFAIGFQFSRHGHAPE